MKKSIFEDGKDWTVIVWGDWRDAEGKVRKYTERISNKKIHITGGLGFYYYFRGYMQKAIDAWKEDLEVIKWIEETEKRRFHKGLFYYQIGLAYRQFEAEKIANKYMGLAKRQDKLTYGKKAREFPSFKKE